MNKQELEDAKVQLEANIEDWATDHPELVKFPDILAKDAAEFVFTTLLGAEDEDE